MDTTDRVSARTTVMHWLFVGLLVCTSFLANTAQAVEFTTPTTIGANDTTYDGQTITVNGTTLTIDGAHTFVDVNLINGAVLTQSNATSPTSSKLVITTTSLNIDANSNIDVSSKGLLPTVEVTGYSGGSYGGRGGNAN
ncbi:MAG TPA: hypothetical protein ENI80_08250, partial [Acidiferrobacteraceae bacterium]|nr:hypothetical protein [Acidiferrobacteraceae bacterium]